MPPHFSDSGRGECGILHQWLCGLIILEPLCTPHGRLLCIFFILFILPVHLRWIENAPAVVMRVWPTLLARLAPLMKGRRFSMAAQDASECLSPTESCNIFLHLSSDCTSAVESMLLIFIYSGDCCCILWWMLMTSIQRLQSWPKVVGHIAFSSNFMKYSPPTLSPLCNIG